MTIGLHRATTAVVSGVAGIGALAALVALDPTRRAVLPACPLHALTGLWCPGCGMTRGTYALVTGHPIQALSYNLFTPVILGLIVVSWLAWAAPTLGFRQLPVRGSVSVRTGRGLLAAMAVFTVVRNIPAFSALAP